MEKAVETHSVVISFSQSIGKTQAFVVRRDASWLDNGASSLLRT